MSAVICEAVMGSANGEALLVIDEAYGATIEPVCDEMGGSVSCCWPGLLGYRNDITSTALSRLSEECPPCRQNEFSLLAADRLMTLSCTADQPPSPSASTSRLTTNNATYTAASPAHATSHNSDTSGRPHLCPRHGKAAGSLRPTSAPIVGCDETPRVLRGMTPKGGHSGRRGVPVL